MIPPRLRNLNLLVGIKVTSNSLQWIGPETPLLNNRRARASSTTSMLSSLNKQGSRTVTTMASGLNRPDSINSNNSSNSNQTTYNSNPRFNPSRLPSITILTANYRVLTFLGSNLHNSHFHKLAATILGQPTRSSKMIR